MLEAGNGVRCLRSRARGTRAIADAGARAEVGARAEARWLIKACLELWVES